MKKEEKIQKKTFPYEFRVELETRAHGNVVARCPDLPGCQAQGRNPKEAMERLKGAMDLFFASATPASFEGLETFDDIPTIYDLNEFKGALYAATGRDQVLKSSNGAPGSWKRIAVTKTDSKFFTPTPNRRDGAGDYATQIYCLCPYGPTGKKSALYAGTNLAGSVYVSADGENWKEAFSSGEDRVHCLQEFNGRLYAGTSSKGKIYAYDGFQWNTVASLTEAAVTCLGVFQDRLWAGTYPGGLLFSTPDGLNWEEMTVTGQSFVQCLKEFQGMLYAGTSGAKGVKVYRTGNGRDWSLAYENPRDMNLYVLEEFEGALFAGTGNVGRILKSTDGKDWKAVFSGDAEGVRALALFGDYLYAGTENGGGFLRSTFDMARVPEITDLRMERLSSCSALLTWQTDIASTTEVLFAEKGTPLESRKVVLDRALTLKHRAHLTDLKAETDYEAQVVSTHRTSSQAVTEAFEFRTLPVAPPALSSTTHPDSGKWERHGNIEMLMHPSSPLAGYYYELDASPGTVPAPPDASLTETSRVALASTPQGEWWFHVVGVDEAGNIGTQASHYRIRIDTEALPPPKVSSPTHPDPEKWTADPTPVVAWEAASDLSGVKGYFVKLDHDPTTVAGPGNGEATQERRLTFGPLEDGLWYAHVTAQDQAGNVGQGSAHLAIRIDTRAVAPSLSSPSHPQEGQWYSNNRIRVEIAPPHDLSGIEGYYHLLDQEPATLPDPSNAQWTDKPSLAYPDVKDGVWYVHVRTKDRAGNLSPTAAHWRVQVDTLAAPPKVASPSHAEVGRWYRNRRVILEWEDPFEHSGIEGYYYNIDRRPDTVPNDKTSLFTAQRNVSFELTDDGLWYFHITTRDKAGNVDAKAVHFPLRVDTEAPKPYVTSPSHPEQEVWYREPKVRFHFSAPDDLSGITGYYYLLSEDPAAVPDPSTAAFTDKKETVLDLPRDGVHYLSVIAQDAAGNVSQDAALYKVRLDSTAGAPELSSPSHPDDSKWYGQRRVELTWQDPKDLSGIEGYYYLLNREEHWKGDVPAMSWTTSRDTVLNLPDDGVWFAHVRAKDRAGNLGPLATLRIQADCAALPPEIKSPTHSANQWIKNNTPKFMWETPREFSGVAGYYLALDSQPHTVPGPKGGKWVTETSVTSPPLKDGKWFFHAATKDGVGNVSREAAHYCVWIDTQPPKSRMKALPTVMDKTAIPVEWSATDAHSGVDSFDVQVKVGRDGPWTDWLSNANEGSAVYKGEDGKRYAFRCRARDLAGNLETYPEGEMTAVTLDISPPQAVTQLKAVPKAGGDIELAWGAVEDAVSGTAFYRVYRWTEGGPKTRISADGEVKGVTYLDAGGPLRENTVYYYCVQAVDRMGNEQHEGNQTAACLSDHGVGTPAVTSPTHSSDDWSSNPSPVLTWTAPADATGIAGYYHLLDQSPNTRPDEKKASFTEERRLELEKLESGIWYFHLLAKDRAGNLSEHPAHFRLKIDSVRPAAPHVVSPTHPDRRWYSSNKVEFKLTAAPKLSGVDCFYYALDRKADTLPQPDGSVRTGDDMLALKIPEAGEWWLHAVVRDKAGNLSEPVHYPLLVAGSEMPPPVVASPTHPREDEASNSYEPFLSWEDRHDGSFKPMGYVYKVSANETEKLSGDDQFTTERSVQLKNVGEGVWYFHVAAVGKKGKPGALSAKRRLIVRRMGKVWGTFLRKDGTTPLVGAKVEILSGDQSTAMAVTDGKGRFRFANLPEGRYELRLHSDQFPVLRLKDVAVTAEEGIEDAVFTEDAGIFPTPPKAGPIRFYYFLKEDCNVTLEILDAGGHLAGKIEERKEGGSYNTTLWDAAGKTAGEYMLKLSAKSLTKNAMSRYTVKKFRIEKGSKEPERQPSPVG